MVSPPGLGDHLQVHLYPWPQVFTIAENWSTFHTNTMAAVFYATLLSHPTCVANTLLILLVRTIQLTYQNDKTTDISKRKDERSLTVPGKRDIQSQIYFAPSQQQ